MKAHRLVSVPLAPERSGPPFSFERVYRDHAAAVARWAAKLAGEGVDIDEAVQKVFVVVSRRLGHFRGDAAITTWLFRITAKVVANERRSVRRARFWRRLTRGIEDRAPANTPGPGDGLEERQASRRFVEVMDSLPNRYREVLVLYEMEELSTDEIARLMRSPAPTVRVWLHRARSAFTARWTELKERSGE